MHDFTSSLLREKFVIHDAKAGPKDRGTVALSNRFVVELRDAQEKRVETFIVRGHNMHSVVRMAARIIHDFDNGGPISIRQSSYDWEKVWDSIVNDYEYAYNPQRWAAIYAGGKCVFEAGERHPFLDMIEKCDADNKLDYDYAVPLAEKLFQQAGQEVRIEHEANVALSVNFEEGAGRLGIILRGSNKTTTFSFTARPKGKNDALNIPQCLGAAAAFLEGVQMSFMVGMNIEKIRLGIIERLSKEEKQTREGRQRLTRLAAEISNLENAFDVHYRPEKPEFHLLMAEAEELGQRILEPPANMREGGVE
ncbi:MAG: hypothetical protein R3E13_09930 [Alphaproteobacteria bacterium]